MTDEEELTVLQRQRAILEKAEAAYKIAIPGLTVSAAMSVMLFWTQDRAMAFATIVIWAVSLGALRVGRHYRNKVL